MKTVIGFLSPTELTVVCVIALVLFGGAAIPKFAKSLGRAKKEFEEGVKEGQKKGDDENKEPESDDSK